ncbi:MAG: carbonic anhydrase family protein [Chitinophagaceae bacterium]
MTSKQAFLCLMTSIFFYACKETPPATPAVTTDDINIPGAHVLTTRVLTAEEQAQLTPDTVISRLKSGNQEYTEDRLVVRNSSERIRKAALGQFPKAVILSCLDSRVPVEDVFHMGIGDLFVARVAGNIVNEDILGSMEFGCKVSGAKVILVLGHAYCGAIKSAIDSVQLGNITAMLAKIQPAVKNLASYTGEKKSTNAEFVEKVCAENVRHAIEVIRAQSPILKQMEDEHAIKIIGAVYDMETGKVNFL